MFNRGSQRDMASLPFYTKDGSPRHPASRTIGSSGAAAVTAPQQHASQLLQQMSAGLWTLAAPLAPVAVLCAGIYVTSLEAGPGRPVDRQSCSCNCWDGRWVVAALSTFSKPVLVSIPSCLMKLPSVLNAVETQSFTQSLFYGSSSPKDPKLAAVTHVTSKVCVTPAPHASTSTAKPLSTPLHPPPYTLFQPPGSKAAMGLLHQASSTRASTSTWSPQQHC